MDHNIIIYKFTIGSKYPDWVGPQTREKAFTDCQQANIYTTCTYITHSHMLGHGYIC